MTTRNDARETFSALGITAADLTRGDIRDLENRLAEALKNAQCLKMRIDRRRTRIQDTQRGRCISIRCRAEYFDNREAVTFNPDGFVGFAGWADDLNIRPFLDGFSAWCEELGRRAELGAGSPAQEMGL